MVLRSLKTTQYRWRNRRMFRNDCALVRVFVVKNTSHDPFHHVTCQILILVIFFASILIAKQSTRIVLFDKRWCFLRALINFVIIFFLLFDDEPDLNFKLIQLKLPNKGFNSLSVFLLVGKLHVTVNLPKVFEYFYFILTCFSLAVH